MNRGLVSLFRLQITETNPSVGHSVIEVLGTKDSLILQAGLDRSVRPQQPGFGLRDHFRLGATTGRSQRQQRIQEFTRQAGDKPQQTYSIFT